MYLPFWWSEWPYPFLILLSKLPCYTSKAETGSQYQQQPLGLGFLNTRLLGKGFLKCLCPLWTCYGKNLAHLAADSSGQASTALLLLRLTGCSMLLLNTKKITTALAPRSSDLTRHYNRYPFSIYGQNTAVTCCYFLKREKQPLSWNKLSDQGQWNWL